MKFRSFLTFAAVCVAVPATAERIFLDDPNSCHLLEQEDGILDFAGNGGLILNESGFSSLEYFCEFKPGLQFHWDGWQTSTHVGHCEEPGPFYTPTLFTFMMAEDEPGVVVLFDGSEEPTRFYSCTD